MCHNSQCYRDKEVKDPSIFNSTLFLSFIVNLKLASRNINLDKLTIPYEATVDLFCRRVVDLSDQLEDQNHLIGS
jgi:hypothetical protein